MAKIGIFMANGCEMIEALTVVDVVRRAGITIDTISINADKAVTSSHKVTFLCDLVKEEADYNSYDAIVLPGGVPGVPNLTADDLVLETVRSFAAQGKLVAAICAAPSVLAKAGILDGKHATCHPAWVEKLEGSVFETDPVVKDGKIITSRGMGTSLPFAFAIVEYFKGQEIVDQIKTGIVYGC